MMNDLQCAHWINQLLDDTCQLKSLHPLLHDDDNDDAREEKASLDAEGPPVLEDPAPRPSNSKRESWNCKERTGYIGKRLVKLVPRRPASLHIAFVIDMSGSMHGVATIKLESMQGMICMRVQYLQEYCDHVVHNAPPAVDTSSEPPGISPDMLRAS